MCLKISQKESLIAENDIVCYKTVNIDSGIIISQYRNFIYKLDKLYKTKFVIIDNKIEDGFHSYPISEYERIKNFLNCVKCIIPKGAKYYIGTYDGHDCYCSNKIMVTEIVSDRNKNQYINGRKNGYWEWYYDNGNIASKGTYKDDLMNGYWESYHTNGKLECKGNYKDGLLNEYWERYHDNGQLWNKGNYKNGIEEGYWERYYDNGQLWNKGNYKDGIEEGYWERYYENGNISSKGNYKNGEKEGEWKYYI